MAARVDRAPFLGGLPVGKYQFPHTIYLAVRINFIIPYWAVRINFSVHPDLHYSQDLIEKLY